MLVPKTYESSSAEKPRILLSIHHIVSLAVLSNFRIKQIMVLFSTTTTDFLMMNGCWGRRINTKKDQQEKFIFLFHHCNLFSFIQKINKNFIRQQKKALFTRFVCCVHGRLFLLLLHRFDENVQGSSEDKRNKKNNKFHDYFPVWNRSTFKSFPLWHQPDTTHTLTHTHLIHVSTGNEKKKKLFIVLYFFCTPGPKKNIKKNKKFISFFCICHFFCFAFSVLSE